jgi:uncharacterized protein (TIGR03083 family)
MTLLTPTDVRSIAPLDHDEAMSLAEVEYRRFLTLVRSLAAGDWTKPTDCTLWDVRAMVGHNLGNIEAAASVVETIRQQARAARRAKREGVSPLDAMTAVQVDARAGLSVDDLIDRLATAIPKAVAGRRRIPSVVRGKVRLDLSEGRKRPLGDLVDRVYTRDVLMHRIDLHRATGVELVLTADHEGRIVADVVAEWATNHDEPFDLTLTGVAGGRFTSGSGGEVLEIDAVEFCRILAGRAPGAGLLATPVLF